MTTITKLMYFSVDVETDGDAPGVSNMLSIGVVALNPETHSHANSFYATLRRLPDARPLNTTMEWWDQFPEAWAAARANAQDPAEAMKALDDFIARTIRIESARMLLPTGTTLEPRFLAYPANFDWQWVNYYFHRFLGRNPFGFVAFDLSSFGAGLKNDLNMVRRSNWPKEWTEGLPDHDHHALHDAEHQAEVFRRMVKG